jgi:hypothetical protein
MLYFFQAALILLAIITLGVGVAVVIVPKR